METEEFAEKISKRLTQLPALHPTPIAPSIAQQSVPVPSDVHPPHESRVNSGSRHSQSPDGRGQAISEGAATVKL